jgi:hypothetical protein
MTEGITRRAPMPRREDYAVVDGSRGPGRDFRIRVGVRRRRFGPAATAVILRRRPVGGVLLLIGFDKSIPLAGQFRYMAMVFRFIAA